MRNNMLRLKRFGYRLIRFLPVLAGVLTSCEPPLPITPELVAAAEDTIPPSITITSPADDSVFFSTTVITGKISDHALKSGDNLGSLSSITATAGGNRAHKGKILIDSAGNVKPVASTDAAAGDAVITYNANTDDFTITMDTRDLDRNINIRITALDLNGNSGASILNLSNGSGPSVEFNTEESSGSELTQTQLRSTIKIRGKIEDSKGSNSIDEIASVIFAIPEIGLRHPMDLTKLTKGIYETKISGIINPGSSNEAVFRLDKENGSFSCDFLVLEQDREKVKTGLSITIEAIDKNGRGENRPEAYPIRLENSSPKLILDKPSQAGPYYYSSVSKGVYSSGDRLRNTIVFDGLVQPNSREPGSPTVTQVELSEDNAKLASPVTFTLTDVAVPPGALGDKEFNHSFPIAPYSGDLSFRITAKDSAGATAALIRIFRDDPVDPVFRGVNLVKSGSSGATPGSTIYAKGGDSVRMAFSSISDVGSGLNLDTLEISGTHDNSGYTGQLKAQTTPGRSVNIAFPASKPPAYPAEGTITFRMKVEDNVKNPAVETRSLTYYHAAPTAAPSVTVSKTTTPSSLSTSGYLRAGNKIRARFTSKRELNLAASNTEIDFTFGSTPKGTYSVSKVGAPAADGTITYESGEYTIAAGDSGPVNWRLKYVDMAGNNASYPSTGGTATGLTVDTAAPDFSTTTAPTITGGNAGIGDSITVNFTLNEAQISTSKPTVSLQTSDGDTITVPAARVSPVAGTGRTAWQAVYTVQASDTTATPPVPAYSGTINGLDVTATDAAGNRNPSPINWTLSGVTIDNTRPDLSGTPTIISNNSVSTTTKAGINNTITVEFTLSESQKTGVDPTVKLLFGTSGPITVPAADVSAVGTGRTAWRAVYTVQASDTTATPPVPAYSGAVTLNVEAEDAAGNTTPAAIPLSHSFSTFTIDNTAPTVSITAVESDYSADTAKANLGSKLLVKFTASDAGGIRTPASTDVTVTGISSPAVGTPSLTSGVYQAETRALTASDPDGSTPITASVTVYDLFGNSSTASLNRSINVDTTMPDFSTTTAPTITGGNAGIGDTITVNFTLNEAQISTSKPTVSLQTSDGDTITVPAARVSPVAGTGRTAWQAVYTVQASDTTATPPVPAYSGTINGLDVTATDAAGNRNPSPINWTLSGVTIDNTRPDLSGTPTIISNNSVSTTTKAGINNTITVEFTLSESQKTGVDPTVKLLFGTSGPITVPAADVSAVGTGRTAWRAVYTVQASDTTATPPVPAYSGAVTLNVEAEDAAGNTTPAAIPLSHSFSTFTIDNTAPTVSITAVESDYSADTAKANLGSKLLVKFTASDAGGIRTPASTDVTVTGISSPAVGTPSLTSGVYQAETRALTASDPDGSTPITASVTVYDLFGNSSTASLNRSINVDTTMPDFSTTTAPTITGGNAGIGDTITVNFTLNEAQISTSKPTVRLRTAGGGTIAVPASAVTDVTPVTGTGRTAWRAVYTVQASGGTPAVPVYSGTVNRLDVTATDAAGNRNPSPINRTLSGVTIDNTAPTFTAGLTFNPPQPLLAGYTAPQYITIEVTGVSSDAASVTFTFNSTSHSATKVTGTTNTWRTASVAVPASIGMTANYSVDVKVVDGHGNETNTGGAASIRVQ